MSARNAQITAALFVTLLIISLHVMAAGAGALWRDEANTLALATLPRFSDIWHNLQFDSFPILWPLIVRAYATVVGPMNDPAFRLFGFVIGAGIVTALWINARSFGHSIPLVSLTILGLNAHVIRWGDTMRGYGPGILGFLVTSVLLWRFLLQPTRPRYAAAAIAAIASVNILYYNAVLLLALCAGGFAVALRRNDRRTAAMVVSIGLLAAVSIVPWIWTLRSADRWNVVLQTPSYTFGRFWNKLGHAFSENGAWMRAVWAGTVAIAALSGFNALFRRRNSGLSANQQEAVTFALVALVVGIPANYAFLKLLSYYTEPWYYAALIALTALCADVILGATVRSNGLRVAVAVVAVTLAIAGIIPTSRFVRERITDLDIVAATLDSAATSEDLILVTPWEYGVTFNRYYRGKSQWMTVPPVESHELHRYDQLFAMRNLTDQTLPARRVTDSAEVILRAGHRVFLVGGLAKPPMGKAVYEGLWSMTVEQYFTRHVISRTRVPIPVVRVVSPFELAWVQCLQGWKP